MQGKIEGDCVRCPFHGFYYDEAGQCRGANIDNNLAPLQGLQLQVIQQRDVGSNIEVLV